MVTILPKTMDKMEVLLFTNLLCSGRFWSNQCKSQMVTNGNYFYRKAYLEKVNVYIQHMSCETAYSCPPCSFTTVDRKDWRRHLSSKKHQLTTGLCAKAMHVCSTCGKEYKYASGMSRHRKTCTGFVRTGVIAAQAEHIKELRGMLHEMVDTNRRTVEAVQSRGNVYNTTNKMTVNVFLNEKCKGAMDLKDFVSSMVISASDLDYTRENGYVKGISNIFAKRLEVLGPTERPFHCVDGKRLQFYVKDEGEWNRDGSNRVSESINEVSHKQIQRIKEWERANPDWDKNELGVEQYLATVRTVMGGIDDIECRHSVDDIKRQIGASSSLKSAIGIIVDDPLALEKI